MLEIIKDVPEHVLAVKATGKVTKEEYDTVLMPALNAQASQTKDLNLLMYIDTDVSNFTLGAWWDDVISGLKNIAKWHRTAIVTEEKGVRTFTDAFSNFFPGEFKGFSFAEQDEAKRWVSSTD